MMKPIASKSDYRQWISPILAVLLIIPLIVMFEPAASTQDYICGDTNNDGRINNNDLVYLINHLFRGGPSPEPPESGDVNCDGSLNVQDIIYFIEATYERGPELCGDCP